MLCVIEHLPGICLSCIWSKWNGKLSRSHSLPLDWNIIFCWRVLFLSENRLNFSICFPKFFRMNPSINRSRPITVLCIFWYLSLYVQSHTVAPQNVWIYIKHQHACAQLTPHDDDDDDDSGEYQNMLFICLACWACERYVVMPHTQTNTHIMHRHTRANLHIHITTTKIIIIRSKQSYIIYSAEHVQNIRKTHTQRPNVLQISIGLVALTSAPHTRAWLMHSYTDHSRTHTHTTIACFDSA